MGIDGLPGPPLLPPASRHTANKSPDKWRDKMTFIWSFIWENHQNIFELSWLVASDTSWFYQNFIRCLNINRLFIGKNLLSAIYQGLALSELINLKTFVGILSGLWGFFIHQSEKRVCIILVTKVRDLTELTICMRHCLANFIKTV
jgi:hypothetical protein